MAGRVRALDQVLRGLVRQHLGSGQLVQQCRVRSQFALLREVDERRHAEDLANLALARSRDGAWRVERAVIPERELVITALAER